MRTHTWLVLLVSTVVAGCGGGSSGGGGGSGGGGTGSSKPAPFTCAIGQLSGTWRFHYTETNGTCGAIPEDTAIFGTDAPSGCTLKTRQISSDHCRIDLAFECPTADNRGGTQDWVLTFTQVSDTQLQGTGTVQANENGFSCRSTYDINVTKL